MIMLGSNKIEYLYGFKEDFIVKLEFNSSKR